MILYLHDNDPAGPGEKHGPRGPTHCGTIRDVDYEYQAEQWALDIASDHPNVVRIESPQLPYEWHREGSAMVKRVSR
jgi:hypothetical protein